MTMNTRINFCCPAELREALGAWAAEHGLKRSEAARLLLHRAIAGREPYQAPTLPDWQVEAWTSLLRGLIGDEHLVLTDEVKALLMEAVATLDEREALVIKRRFGLDGPRFTLREVGKAMGVYRSRVHQIEARALRRLRYWLQRQGIWEMVGSQLNKEVK